MEYLAFALKYRPKSFDQVVGQAHVVASLKQAILKSRVHHAYLFSGPRGIGKTSLARILAKSLNCEKGPTVSPCGKCVSCQEISKNKSLDIIEIDGASNRGIDEIRTLRENVKLSPAHSRYKVYIVDEIHMLTQEAFNALLKTLEEPPAHVKFIFATTHPHKVLPTILSRCQKFQFNLISLEDIVAKLKKITKAESIKIDENLLYTVARAAGGSIRDAESLLDQLAPVILEKGSLDDVFSFLGIIDEDSLNRMLKCLIDQDLNSILDFIDRMAKDGKDLGVFLNAFIEHLRNLLLAKVSPKSFKELSDISPQSKDFILELSKGIDTPSILKIIDLLLSAKELSFRLNTVRIPFELVLVKFLHKDTQSIDLKSKPKQSKNEKVEKKEPAKEIDDTFNLEIDDIDIEEHNRPKDPALKEESKDAAAPKDDLLLGPVRAKWDEIINYIQKKRAALASHLSFAKPVDSQGNLVTIAFASKDYFHKEIVENAKNLKFIEEAISELMGKKIGIRFTTKDIKKDPIKAESAQQKPKKSQEKVKETEDNFLNEILDTFDGKFHSEDG